MFLSTTRWSFNNLEQGQWDICMCGGEERQLYSFKFPISPESTAKQGAPGSLTNKWLWHLLHRLAGGHRDTQHPAASWQQNHIPILQSLVCDICIESRSQSTTPATLAMLTHSHSSQIETCICIIRASYSFLQSTGRINSITNRVDGKYCDFEALSQDRNLAVMKWADALNKDVTCYNNDNHDHKIIIEQSMLLMIAASEPDVRYPNSEF